MPQEGHLILRQNPDCGLHLGLMHHAAADTNACALLASCSPIGKHCDAAEEHEAMPQHRCHCTGLLAMHV